MQSICAILYCHLWPIWLYHISYRSSQKHYYFWKRFTEYKMCILISTLFVCNISHYKKNPVNIIKMYIGLNVKYQLFLSDFKQH